MFSLSTPRWRHAKTPYTSPLTLSHLHGWSRVSGPSALLFSLFFALFITLLIATPAHAQESADGLLSANAQAVVADINRMRAANGIAPLAVHPQLVLAAKTHVGDMVANANYSHTGSDDSSIGIRVSRTGFQSTAGVSENWVAVSDPAQAVTWWMNSYIHRTNMLNPKWSHIGVNGKLDARNGMHVFVAVFGANGSGDAVTVIAAASQPVTEHVPAGGMNYTIRPGDTLMGIALRHGLNMSTVTAINSISEDNLLQIGQVIRLPGIGDPAPGVGGAVSATIPENLKTTDYVVRAGDTLISIGVRLNQEWGTIAALNGLGEQSVLHIGQTLRVAASDQNAASSAITTTRSHAVQPGETVITIALKYGLGWKTLLDLNGLGDNSLLTIGQTLRLP